jgi:glycosyltransferase involved in cell wall biosynthesis
MKILYSCLSKSWGGMEMVTLSGLKQLISKNINVQLLCVEESRLQLEANNLGIIIHSIKIKKLINPFRILKLSAIFRTEKYDLIHSHASKDLWLIVPALKFIKYQTPLILTKHVGSFIHKKDFFHNWLYKRITRAIAISSVIKKNLEETTALKEDKIKIIYNGVDLKRFNYESANRNKLRNELHITENDVLLGMTARFSPGKGHEEFISAAANLNKKYSNLKFIVVGEASRGEEQYANKIRLLSQNYKLHNIYFIGFRSDIPDVLAAMDIFVFPSHAEAFGVALIEAMAMERASVCSNSDGILDIAIDNKTSFLFKTRDSKDLTNKLEQLLIDPEKRKTFGTQAKDRVTENFSLEKVTEQTLKLYSELIKGK